MKSKLKLFTMLSGFLPIFLFSHVTFAGTLGDVSCIIALEPTLTSKALRSKSALELLGIAERVFTASKTFEKKLLELSHLPLMKAISDKISTFPQEGLSEESVSQIIHLVSAENGSSEQIAALNSEMSILITDSAKNISSKFKLLESELQRRLGTSGVAIAFIKSLVTLGSSTRDRILIEYLQKDVTNKSEQFNKLVKLAALQVRVSKYLQIISTAPKADVSPIGMAASPQVQSAAAAPISSSSGSDFWLWYFIFYHNSSSIAGSGAQSSDSSNTGSLLSNHETQRALENLGQSLNISTDLDGDGISNSLDNDIDGDGIPNEQDIDDDGDGITDKDDTDQNSNGNNDENSSNDDNDSGGTDDSGGDAGGGE